MATGAALLSAVGAALADVWAGTPASDVWAGTLASNVWAGTPASDVWAGTLASDVWAGTLASNVWAGTPACGVGLDAGDGTGAGVGPASAVESISSEKKLAPAVALDVLRPPNSADSGCTLLFDIAFARDSTVMLAAMLIRYLLTQIPGQVCRLGFSRLFLTVADRAARSARQKPPRKS